jgi:hypothetical protein
LGRGDIIHRRCALGDAQDFLQASEVNARPDLHRFEEAASRSD